MSLEEHPSVDEKESKEEIIISDQQPGEILALLVTAFALDFLAVKDHAKAFACRFISKASFT